MMQHTQPLVTAGVPVFNGESTLRAAIDTLLSQTYSNFRVIISDNCSVDGTEEICTEYAGRDPRITYIRQLTNIGPEANFRFVLEQADTDYFFWATADDTRSPDFILENVAFLEQNPDYVASISPTRFEGGRFDEVAMGDFSLDGEHEDRFLRFFTTWHANGRNCSIFRRRVLLESYRVAEPFLGCDWTAVLGACRVGKLHRSSTGWVVFGAHGISNAPGVFGRYCRHWYEWIFPFARLSAETFKLARGLSLSAHYRLAVILLGLNLRAAVVRLRRSFL